jgi:NAD(P)-dependent dehydrogenase (short-subunit alcohol dehydrogenase family)
VSPSPGFVVTGGAGALGRVVVRALLERGARIAVPYRAAPEWEAFRSSLPGREALWGAPADVADADTAQSFMDEAARWLGRVNGVAALAGAYSASGPLETAPVDEWRRMMSANLGTAYGICRAALPHLLASSGGVVTVASRQAESGGAGAAAYAVSKAAVIALTRVLARENQPRGVRFNCVVPGMIDTAANRTALGSGDLSHLVPPEAIARVVLFLLSPDSAPVTGAIVPVDAARTAPRLASSSGLRQDEPPQRG